MLKQIVAILTILGVAFGAFLYIDARIAKCAEKDQVKQVERRLDYDIESNRLYRMRDQQREFSRDFPDVTRTPAAVQRQMNELDQDIEMQRGKVQKLEGK